MGDRIRERRLELGLTRTALSGRSETATEGNWLVDLQDILRIENGRRLVGDLELRCLAEVLGRYRACWLLLGDTEDVVRRWMR